MPVLRMSGEVSGGNIQLAEMAVAYCSVLLSLEAEMVYSDACQYAGIDS
jgi:hypothetical protein